MLLVSITAIVIALMGAGLAAAGAYLVVLGGSVYYLLTGIGFLVTAFLLFLRRPLALAVYGMIILLSLGWAVWEVGFDWWQLGPRGGVIVVVGIWLALPWIRRRLKRGRVSKEQPARAWPVAIPVLLAVVIAGYSMFQTPHDIDGVLSEAPATKALDSTVPDGEWHQYGRKPLGQRYSPLDKINPANVSSLQEAWRYQTGDVKRPEDVAETTYQVTPLKVGNRLFLCTPHNWAIALDATTGEEIWKYDPKVGMNPSRQHQTCRGVTYHKSAAITSGPCAERVYLPTSDARLIALDAATGAVCESFADKGMLRLETGMLHNPAGYYYSTSPPVIAAGKIIIGGAVNDNYSTKEQSGVIRAFDVETGALIWNTFLTLSGYLLHEHYEMIEVMLDPLSYVVLGLVVVLYLLKVATWKPSSVKA